MKHAIFKQIQDVIDRGVKKGKISDRIILSGKPSIQVYGTEDFAWAFEVGFTYRFN